MQTHYVLLSLICVVACVNLFLNCRKKSNKELEKELKQQALMLIIYAEKQEWIGEDKLKFVIGKMYDKSPEIIKKVIKEDTIEQWVIRIYNEYKGYVKEEMTLPKIQKYIEEFKDEKGGKQ